MGLDFEALRKALEGRALERCTSCGEAEWLTMDQAVLLQYGDPDKPTRQGFGLPAFPIVCSSCGYIRMHSIPVLQGKINPEDHR